MLSETKVTQMSENRNFAEGYKDQLRAFYDFWKKLFEKNPELINLCPSYFLKTSKGTSLKISVFYTDSDDSDQNAIALLGPARRYSLVAENESLGILGHLDMYIRLSTEQNPKAGSWASHVINTGIRGIGVGTPMQLVCNDILQRECNFRKHPLDLMLVNENDEKLQKKISEGSISERDIESAREEQKRWRSIFDQMGLKEGSNIFYPKTETDIKNVRSIEMERNRNPDGKISSVLKLGTKLESDLEFRNLKLTELESLLSKIESAIS